MKTKILQSMFVVLAAFTMVTAQAATTYKPFALASNESGKIADKLEATKRALQSNGFTIAGDYSPYNGAHVIVVTNGELKQAASSHPRAGYIAAQRVALTEMKGKVQVSYTNPYYMAKAYWIKSDLAATSAAFKKALGFVKFFGPEKGLTEKKLGKYHYTFGMEYFDEPLELSQKRSHGDMTSTIEKNLAARTRGATKVFRIDIPNSSQTLFGVGMKALDPKKKYMDEKFIMAEIDFKELRSTAHLPYEILVKGKEAEALHARYRIALNFPDLSMMGSNSFMNIMPTPDAILEVLTLVAGGELKDEDDY